MTWDEKYQAVLSSERWKNLKDLFIRAQNGKCGRCNKSGKLELHHKTYERLGDEKYSDLELLCASCHKIADRERAVEGYRSSQSALYYARLDGWARKRYGDDWDYDYNPEDIEDEFDTFLENIGDA